MALLAFVLQYLVKSFPHWLLVLLLAVAIALIAVGVASQILVRTGRWPKRWIPFLWIGFGGSPVEKLLWRTFDASILHQSLSAHLHAVWSTRTMTAPELRLWVAKVRTTLDRFPERADLAAKFEVHLNDDADSAVVMKRLEELRTELVRELLWNH